MKITRVTPNITQLTFAGFSNCYLVRDAGGFILVDATVSGKEKDIMEAARHMVGHQICSVVLTHAHGDHIGSLDCLAHDLGQIDSVAIGRREEPLLRKDLSLEPGEPKHKPKGSFPGAKTQATHLLDDGDLHGPLMAINTPGHTPGHISLMDTRDGTLIAGDALTAIGKLRIVTDPPWYFPIPRLATWDTDLAKVSARRLLDTQPARIVCGHGTTPVEDAISALKRALSEAAA